MNIDEIRKRLTEVEGNSNESFSLVNELVGKATKGLDEFVEYSSKALSTPSQIPDMTLDYIVLNLPIYIYYSISICECMGFKEDVSELEKKCMIQNVLNDIRETGVKLSTVEKSAIIDKSVSDIALVSSIYSTAYKIIKAKINYAYEILASCKKISTRRIEELKLSNSARNGVVGVENE